MTELEWFAKGIAVTIIVVVILASIFFASIKKP